MKKLTFILGCILLLLSGVSAQLNMTFLGNYPYSPELSDIWGHVDSLGNEYAIVGIQNGVSVVDVTNPSAPIEVFFVTGPNTIWRDIKVWNNHAYITNESSGGLMIIDLSNLPNTSPPAVATYTGSSFSFSSAHDIFIDENGVAYIFGSNYGTGGAIMLDLSIDPMNPVELGVFNNYYLHDGMARGDTLWGAAINNGFFVVVDVSNKSAPSVLATHNTPSNFTHNCWISDDGNTLFTTDEKSNAFITSYDVSNLSNITELDRVQSNPGSNTIVHNTFFMNNFLITSYYRDGVTIHDVTRPANMLQTGYYDTYTAASGNGFNGAWGVYPWLPSGNVIVSDIENGLFILGSNYTRGCYLEGMVTDFNTSNPINNATIEILTAVATTNSDITGDYAINILAPGTYNVVYSAPGYTSDTVIAVLSNGVLTIVDVQLISPIPIALFGQVVESNGGNPIANAEVLIVNNDFQFQLSSDGSGNFSIPTFFEGAYDMVVGKWLYKTTCTNTFLDSNSSPIIIALDSGIYDDFTFDFSWSVSGSAPKGIWIREEPVGTDYNGTGDANPKFDVSTDCMDQAFVTGNGGGSAGNDDVDDGTAILKSPLFDVTAYTEPYVKYDRWFFNDGGSGTPNDTLIVRISNGAVSMVLEEVTESSSGNSSWVTKAFKISDYLTPTNLMQLTLETADNSGSGHLVEAGLDLFMIVDDYSVSVVNSNASCNGACDAGAVATAVGGVMPLTYLWDDPATQSTDTATGLCAGTYTAMVIDALGDTATTQITITQPVAISVTSSSSASCAANTSDAIVAASNGVAPYSYLWNDGNSQTTQTATGLSVGTYTVTVTDNNGCSSTSSITTTTNVGFSAMVFGTNPTTCGGSDGSGTAIISNGSTPYAFAWDDVQAQSTATATGLNSGSYIVTVTDGGGCSDTGLIVLIDVGSPVLTINSVTMPSCFGVNNGAATVSVSGATGPYTYSWSTSPTQTDSVATGLIAGTYSVNVTSSGVCTASISVTIAEPDAQMIFVGGTDPLCFGDQSGTVSVSGSGGTGLYTYFWSIGQNTQFLDSLSEGTYSVYWVDGNGCISSTDSVTLTDPPPITTSSAITNMNCLDDSSGAIVLAISGGTPPFTYLWSNGSITKDISNLAAGTYSLTASDSNGCSITESYTVSLQSSGVQTSPIVGPNVVSETSNESYAVAPNSGSSFDWSVVGGTQIAGSNQNSIVVQWNTLGSGQVAVIETDSLGCAGDTVILFVSIATSISPQKTDFKKVLIYPNPNQGFFVLELNLLKRSKLSLALYNLTGECVYSKDLNNIHGYYSQSIDVRAKAAGIYFLQIISERSTSTSKIIIQ